MEQRPHNNGLIYPHYVGSGRDAAYVRQAMLVGSVPNGLAPLGPTTGHTISSINNGSMGRSLPRPSSARNISTKYGQQATSQYSSRHRPTSASNLYSGLSKEKRVDTGYDQHSAKSGLTNKGGIVLSPGHYSEKPIRPIKSATAKREEDVVIVESGKYPGVKIAMRSLENKERSPERLNLDRKDLSNCCLLQGEEQLRLLNYQHNFITKIRHMNNLNNLVFLDMYNNKITEISGLEYVPNIRVLMLGKNNIRIISGLDNLRKLDVLDIHSNHISRIEGLQSLLALRILNLAGNLITSMDDLSMLSMLTELNLRRNALDSFSIPQNSNKDTLSKKLIRNPFPQKLQRLFLSHNKISSLGDIALLSSLTMLRELALDCNPISTVDKTSTKEYRVSIINICGRLNRLDMTMISDDERKAATNMLRKGISIVQKFQDLQQMEEIAPSTTVTLENRDNPSKIIQPSPTSTCEKEESIPAVVEGTNISDSDNSRSESNGDAITDENHRSQSPLPVVDKVFPPNELIDVKSDKREERFLRISCIESIKTIEKTFSGEPLFIDIARVQGNELRKILNYLKFYPIGTLKLSDTNFKELVDFLPVSHLPDLRSLHVAQGNPVKSDPLFRPFVCICLPKLGILNGSPITVGERIHSEELMKPLQMIYKDHLRFCPTKSLVVKTVSDFDQHASMSLLMAEKAWKNTDTSQIGNSGLAAALCRQMDAMITVKTTAQRRLTSEGSKSNHSTLAAKNVIEEGKIITELSDTFESLWPQVLEDLVEEALCQSL